MKLAAWWKDAKARFEELLHAGGHDLEVWGVELHGGTPALRNLFKTLARGTGRAVDDRLDAGGYETWVTALGETLQPLYPDYFSVYDTESTRRKPRLVPLSQIDLPARSKKGRGNNTDLGIEPTKLIDAVERAEMYMPVLSKGRRFVVHPEHRPTYEAYRALHRAIVPCVLFETQPSGTPKARVRSPRVITRERSHDVIHRVCEASIRLCELFEAEAFAQDQTPTTAGNTPRSTRREAQKLATQVRYRRWQKAYRGLKKEHPGMSGVWYSQRIARQPIGASFSPETIRKHIKTCNSWAEVLRPTNYNPPNSILLIP